MGEFFKGWRRKIGVATLTIALLSAGAWIRSLTVQDALIRLNQNDTHIVISMDGRIAWSRCWPIVQPRPSRWMYRHDKNPGYEDSTEGLDVHWNFSGPGFVYCAHSDKEGTPPHTLESEVWQIPYWSLAIPFAALSAWLLLGKSRQATLQPAAESTSSNNHAAGN